MPGWKTNSSEEVYKTPWIRVRRDEVTNHRGKALTYSVVELASPAVFVVAMDDQGRVLLQHQYRYPVGQAAWTLPAGHSDGENLLVAAQRELKEETGLAAKDWSDLGSLHVGAGVVNFPSQFFLAQTLTKTSDNLDEDEDILERRWFSFAQLSNMVLEGTIGIAETLAGVMLAQVYLNAKKEVR